MMILNMLFSPDDFNSKTREEKWDRVKVVCSQPFKKGEQFGVSLLKITGFTNDDNYSDESVTPKSNRKEKTKVSGMITYY